MNQPCIDRLEQRRLLAAVVEDVAGRASGDAFPARYVESLDRGVVAINKGSGNVYVGWRLLGNDSPNVAFNLYRVYGNSAPVKRNATPITATTDFNDTGVSFATTVSYFVRPVIDGVEQADSARFTLPVNAPTQSFLNVPLQIPAGGTTPTGEAYTYSANDASVGDLDGDGDYEIILKWEPSNAKDNSQSGYTGNVYIDAYQLDGTRMWRIDLGRNIRAGAHYTQFIVYDLDSDGKAEVAMKTAPGTVDGTGANVLMGNDLATADYRNSGGYILTGSEYLTVFSGQTGANMATVAYNPPRGTVSAWGDSYGNRVDRFLAGVAYLDGERPSLIMARGYYTRAAIAAWDWRGGQLTQRWLFDTGNSTSGPLSGYRGQGAHSLSIADVDADGKDEIVYGAATIDDNGTGLYTTRLGHGDALHVSDMIPSRPGLEVFQVHEDANAHQGKGGTLRDARTGEVISFVPGTGDVGRGNAFDIDPRYPGYEMWTTGDAGIYNADGTYIQAKPSNMFVNFGVWWDADPLRELLDGTTVSDYRITNGTGGRFNYLAAPNVSSNNGTKSTPALAADILGDWREEVIWRRSDSTALHIYTTTITSTMRLFTLMHDTQYRTAVAWQNVGYNQPTHPSFFLGEGMAMPPQPNIITTPYSPIPEPELETYQGEDAVLAGGTFVEATNGGFNASGYINFPTTDGSLTWNRVDGNAGGATTIRLRYALGATTSRTAQLVVNGVATNITFAPTGSWTTWTTLPLTVNLNPGRNNVISIASIGQDSGNIDELQVIVNPDTQSPTFTSGSFDVNTATVKMVFSEDVGVSLSLDDFIVLGPTGVVTPTALSFDLTTSTATLTLPKSLVKGSYTVSAFADGIADHAGNLLSGGISYLFSYLPGDASGNGTVDFDDLLLIAQNYGKTGAALWTEGDFNYDGKIDFDDLLIVAQGYGTSSLAAATPKVAATPAEVARDRRSKR